MLRQAGSALDKNKDRSPWLQRCQDWKARYPVVLPEHRAPGLVSLYHLAEVVGRKPDRTTASSPEARKRHRSVPASLPRAQRPPRVHTAGLGAMGYGIPASIGVCLGSGGKKTICVDGDGGLQLNIQELATIAHLQLPIKLFVLNNQGYASIRASQTNYFGAPTSDAVPKLACRFPIIARSLAPTA